MKHKQISSEIIIAVPKKRERKHHTNGGARNLRPPAMTTQEIATLFFKWRR